MALKLSIFTTITNPVERGDLFTEALTCYTELADEVIVVNGGKLPIIDPTGKIREIGHPWHKEFSWEFIGQQFQRGYEAAVGDWVIHADLDFLFHERDFQTIRQTLEDNKKQPALSFWKYQFVLPHSYNLKSRLVVAVNKKAYGNRIKFDSGGDLCQPSLDGVELKPDNVPEARIPLYNYEKILKTQAQITDDVGRMARAWKTYFGEDRLGASSDAKAYELWYNMVSGRYTKPKQRIPLQEHPKYIKDTIINLQPHQFGFNGFGLGEIAYV